MGQQLTGLWGFWLWYGELDLLTKRCGMQEASTVTVKQALSLLSECFALLEKKHFHDKMMYKRSFRHGTASLLTETQRKVLALHQGECCTAGAVHNPDSVQTSRCLLPAN